MAVLFFNNSLAVKQRKDLTTGRWNIQKEGIGSKKTLGGDTNKLLLLLLLLIIVIINYYYFSIIDNFDD